MRNRLKIEKHKTRAVKKLRNKLKNRKIWDKGGQV
jgi:hypothetical protein